MIYLLRYSYYDIYYLYLLRAGFVLNRFEGDIPIFGKWNVGAQNKVGNKIKNSFLKDRVLICFKIQNQHVITTHYPLIIQKLNKIWLDIGKIRQQLNPSFSCLKKHVKTTAAQSNFLKYSFYTIKVKSIENRTNV